MNLGLTGKTAVVTGASQGVGLATTQALANEGVRVVGAARTVTPELEETAVATVAADFSTRVGVNPLMDTAFSTLGGIDILINNVGAGDVANLALGGLAGFLEVDDHQWHELFRLNLFSAIWAS